MEVVSNGRPINIYFYTICLQNGIQHALQNDIQNSSSEINSFVPKMLHVKKEWYAYEGVYTYTPQLSL